MSIKTDLATHAYTQEMAMAMYLCTTYLCNNFVEEGEICGACKGLQPRLEDPFAAAKQAKNMRRAHKDVQWDDEDVHTTLAAIFAGLAGLKAYTLSKEILAAAVAAGGVFWFYRSKFGKAAMNFTIIACLVFVAWELLTLL